VVGDEIFISNAHSVTTDDTIVHYFSVYFKVIGQDLSANNNKLNGKLTFFRGRSNILFVAESKSLPINTYLYK